MPREEKKKTKKNAGSSHAPGVPYQLDRSYPRSRAAENQDILASHTSMNQVSYGNHAYTQAGGNHPRRLPIHQDPYYPHLIQHTDSGPHFGLAATVPHVPPRYSGELPTRLHQYPDPRSSQYTGSAAGFEVTATEIMSHVPLGCVAPSVPNARSTVNEFARAISDGTMRHESARPHGQASNAPVSSLSLGASDIAPPPASFDHYGPWDQHTVAPVRAHPGQTAGLPAGPTSTSRNPPMQAAGHASHSLQRQAATVSASPSQNDQTYPDSTQPLASVPTFASSQAWAEHHIKKYHPPPKRLGQILIRAYARGADNEGLVDLLPRYGRGHYHCRQRYCRHHHDEHEHEAQDCGSKLKPLKDLEKHTKAEHGRSSLYGCTKTDCASYGNKEHGFATEHDVYYHLGCYSKPRTHANTEDQHI